MVLAKGLLLSVFVVLATGAFARGDPASHSGADAWMTLPTGADFARLYPQDALEQGVSGAVLMGCSALPNGTLSACQIYGERPAGLDFGNATVALARTFRLKPGELPRESPVPNWVVVPVKWESGERVGASADFVFGDSAGFLRMRDHTAASAVDQGIACLTEGSAPRCAVHQFYWTARPDRLPAARSILKAGKTKGLDQIVCAVEGSFRRCWRKSGRSRATLDPRLAWAPRSTRRGCETLENRA